MEEKDLSVKTVPKDQETANIEAYARIYRKCLEAARTIVISNDENHVIEVASALFSQFQHDQVEIVKQKQLVGMIGKILQGRPL